MPRKRVSMRKIREVLRLKWSQGLSDRRVARSCKVGKSSISEYVRRAKAAGLSWPLPPELDDEELEARLFAEESKTKVEKPKPDWAYIHKELKRKGVSKFLLWEEYRIEHTDGLAYSTFNQQYRDWCGKQNLSMRQHHIAGEKLYVDYAGMTVDITDAATGEIKEAQVFVGALGASNYTYTEVTWTQSSEDWIASHCRMLSFLGGVPEIIVPDNLKSGVTKANYYEPDINKTYLDFAEHYDVAIIPTRVRKPKDKAKVEKAVQVVEGKILAPLRNRTFFNLAEANEAIALLLTELNSKQMQKQPWSRKDLFEELEKPVLRELPKDKYVLAKWKQATVHIDYHVALDGFYYSVPYEYAQKRVDLRYTQTSVEVFYKNKRIATHLRKQVKKGRKHITVKEHMPEQHSYRDKWTPQRFTSWAEKIGPYTTEFITALMDSRKHPEQSFRACRGVIRLGKSYTNERLEAACHRACFLQSYSYKSIESILKNKLDTKALPTPIKQQDITQQHHQNVRGPDYYQKNQQEHQHLNPLQQDIPKELN